MKAGDLVLTPRGLRVAGRLLPCTIGRGRLSADKREGDGATPRGTMRVAGMLYRPDRMVRPAPWAVPIRPRHIWSDDPADPHYNHLTTGPRAFSHETMRRADPLYDLVILTDWNWPDAAPGKGSAIFLHRWRRPGFPTEGCIAMAPGELLWLASRLERGTRLIVD